MGGGKRGGIIPLRQNGNEYVEKEIRKEEVVNSEDKLKKEMTDDFRGEKVREETQEKRRKKEQTCSILFFKVSSLDKSSTPATFLKSNVLN